MRARVIKGKRNKAIVGKILYFLFYSLTLQPDPFITLSLYLTVSSDIADIRGGEVIINKLITIKKKLEIISHPGSPHITTKF
jgi:hypothetical protein